MGLGIGCDALFLPHIFTISNQSCFRKIHEFIYSFPHLINTLIGLTNVLNLNVFFHLVEIDQFHLIMITSSLHTLHQKNYIHYLHDTANQFIEFKETISIFSPSIEFPKKFKFVDEMQQTTMAISLVHSFSQSDVLQSYSDFIT